MHHASGAFSFIHYLRVSLTLLQSLFINFLDDAMNLQGIYKSTARKSVRRSCGFANLVQTRVIQACLKNAECSRDSLREIRRQKRFDHFKADL